MRRGLAIAVAFLLLSSGCATPLVQAPEKQSPPVGGELTNSTQVEAAFETHVQALANTSSYTVDAT